MSEHKESIRELKVVRQFIDILDTNGDGTGETNANGNYLAQTEFFIAPPENENYLIYQMSVSIEDAGKVSYELYGNDVVLTGSEGCSFEIKTLGATQNLFDERVNDANLIQTNKDYLITTVGGFTVYPNDVGNKWFGQAVYVFNSPKMLYGHSGDRLAVQLLGDFTSLTSHKFYVHGQVVKHRLVEG